MLSQRLMHLYRSAQVMQPVRLTLASWRRLPPRQSRAARWYCRAQALPRQHPSRRWQRRLQRRSGSALPRRLRPAATLQQLKNRVQTKHQVQKQSRMALLDRSISFPLALRGQPSSRPVSRPIAEPRPYWCWRRHQRRGSAWRWRRDPRNCFCPPGRQGRHRAIVWCRRWPAHRPRGAARRVAVVPLSLPDR